MIFTAGVLLFSLLFSRALAGQPPIPWVKWKPSAGASSSSGATQSGIRFHKCNKQQQSVLTKSAVMANWLIQYANNYLDDALKKGKPDDRYTKYFGEYEIMRFNAVQHHFFNMKDKATTYTYDCGTCAIDHADIYRSTDAFIKVSKKPRKIYLCSQFWSSSLPLIGRGSKPGVIIRLISQFPENGGATDHYHLPHEVVNPATVDPEKAVLNAENHRLFAETYWTTPRKI